ncbi:MAG TPA: glycosyltransferase family 39 protein [Aggregatilineaceae bacterium]|nr:glycosyltransferase family 39 protein [Aggregatilineaceae bacterium]
MNDITFAGQREALSNFSPAGGTMHLESVGVGRTTVDSRVVYGADTRFGREVSVGPRYFIGGVILIMLVGFALRVWNLGGASLWTDEALTAVRADAPFRQSLASIMAAGNQSPLYFWAMRLVPHSTDMLLRLPSALMGLLGIGLMMLIVVRLYRDREMALWAGALLAVNPFHVWLSRTARPYSMLFVLGLLVSYFFLMLLRGNRTRAMWVGFTISSMVAYSTHFTTVALPAAQYVLFAFMLREKHGFFRRWIIAQAVAAAPALFWVYIVLRQPMAIASEWIPRPGLRDIPLTLWNMTLGYDGVFKWHMVPGLMVVTLGIVLGMGYALQERRTNRKNFLWLWLVVVPFFPIFIMSKYVVSIYVDRYFTVLLPGVLLLIIWGWMHYSRQVWRIALGIMVATGVYVVLFSFYDGSFRRADWRQAADYVAEQVQPGDAIMLDRDNALEAFSHYYGVNEHVLSSPTPCTIVLLSSTPDTAPIERNATRIWVVYHNPNEDVHRMGLMPDFDPFDPKLTPMGAWLSARRDEVVAQQSFHGVRVLLVDPHQPSMAQGQ